MPRTLADMTPEERRACVGMWATIRAGDDLKVLIVEAHEDFSQISYPAHRAIFQLTRNERITPLFDLMRAWMPDGTPVEMDVEINEVSHGRVYNDGTDRVDFPDGTKVRRFVGDWEATDE